MRNDTCTPVHFIARMALWLLLCCCTLPALSQQRITIKGFVRTSSGEPLPGAGITIKGTTTGVVSGNDGSFRITVPPGSLLRISYTGFIAREIKTGETDIPQLSVQLLTDKSELNEVVVVGYGNQRRSDVTGSIASISGQSLRDVPAANLSQALKGMGAGIDVQKSGGNSKPGATPQILIRGSRSLNASNAPLIVVDGIPFNGDLNDLNPDEIISVDVLKDASSTAIYGSRGANGVLLISTRRGKSGKPVVTYNGYAGFVKPLGKHDVMDAKQYTDFKKWAFMNVSPGTYSGLDDPKFLTDGTFAAEEVEGIKNGRNTDWQDLILKSGMTTNHQIGVSGGSEQTQYAFSGGYYKETGIYFGQSFERFAIKASVDQLIGKRIKVGISSLNNFSTTLGENANPMGQALRASPMSPAFDKDGKVLNGFVPGSANQVWNPLANFVPGAVAERRKRFGTFTTLYADVQLWKGLRYKFNAGAEIRSNNYGNFYASNTTDKLGGPSTSTNDNTQTTSYTLENLLIYDQQFGRHKINFTGLYSLQDFTSQFTTFSNNFVLSDDVEYFNPQLGLNHTGRGEYRKWDILSYMGRLNYNYDDRFLVTLTMRTDGSSRLAPGSQYDVFPSVAGAWNISRENFLRSSTALSNLKLRATFGEVGNTAIDPYETLGRLTPINYNYGSTNVTGVYPTNVANKNLTWEYTSTLNLGVDFAFFNNRIAGSFDYYHARTSSLLLPQTLPPTSGIVNPVLINIGKTENRGIELHLMTVNVQGKGNNDFTWTTDLNFFINRGKITALYDNVSKDINNNWYVGQPIGTIYDLKRIGIWQNTKEDSAYARSLGLTLEGAPSVIGQIRVEDVNKDGVINNDDRIFIGSSQPKWEGGMTNRFAYKGFDFTCVMYARFGSTLNSKILGGGFANTYQGNYNNLNLPYWTPYNKENFYPKPNQGQTQAQYNALMGYVDGSFLKIRSLSLGYNFPPAWLQRSGARSLRIYATAQDPFILFSPYRSRYNGIDPESAGNLNADTPATWSMIFGINLTL